MNGLTLKGFLGRVRRVACAAGADGRALPLCGLSFLLAASVSCGGAGTQGANGNTSANRSQVKMGVKPEPDAEVAVIDVQDFGKIVVELYPNAAPQMVERFKTLARSGLYAGTTFHRVEPPSPTNPGGVIQGGDPNSKDDDYRNDGAGQSDLPDVPAEPSDLPYELGTVGAADAGPGTANCQFFISLGPNPMWERRYTVFGKVIRGINDVKIISTAPVRPGTVNPDPKVVIRNITIEPRANYQ